MNDSKIIKTNYTTSNFNVIFKQNDLHFLNDRQLVLVAWSQKWRLREQKSNVQRKQENFRVAKENFWD